MKGLFNIRTMAEVAVFAAIGFILDTLASAYSHALFHTGGSIGIAMICVMMISFRRGLGAGILTGFIMGLLDLADGFYTIASSWYVVIAQVMLDYIIVYALVGFAGLFRKLVIKEGKSKIHVGWLALGCTIGGLLKFASHFTAGVLFWKDAGANFWGVPGDSLLYSFLYNGSYMVPSIIACVGIMILIGLKWPFLLKDANSVYLKDQSENKGE